MNIPTDIPVLINQNITDPISHAVVYKFDLNEIIVDKDGYIILRFPYSKNTFWTNFKFNSFYVKEPIDIGIILITNDGYTYTISENGQKEKSIWYDTIWPIPSINSNFDAGIYLKIKTEYNITDFTFSLLGFTDIYPNEDNYLLMSNLDTYQFVFHKFEDNFQNLGSIFNVEHYDYIRDIIDRACMIYPINSYY